MSHLLCLNSRTTIPTSAHTIVFIYLLNNVHKRQARDSRTGDSPDRGGVLYRSPSSRQPEFQK
jgi:hypothetical protein